MVKRIALTALALAAFVFIGCGGPPKEEIEKATKAQQGAASVKADVYAKEAFDAGVTAAAKGADAVKKSDWEGAKKSYTEAAKQFDTASKAAPDAEKAAKENAAKVLADTKAAWTALGKDAKLAAAVKALKKDDKAKYDTLKNEAEGAVKAAEGQAGDNPNGALDQLKIASEKIEALKKLALPVKK